MPRQDEGATAVAEALSKTSPDLREMDFSANDLTAEGAAAVADCAGGKKFLEYFGLEEQTIGSAGAKAVSMRLTGKWETVVLRDL